MSITDYGAFVELEPGVEGLIHVSEMSWTKKVKHPSKVLEVGQELDCQVLEVDAKAKRISLGLKQLEPDPWTLFTEKYHPGDKIGGKVRTLTDYGVFIGIEEGVDGMVHKSDLSWTAKVNNPATSSTRATTSRRSSSSSTTTRRRSLSASSSCGTTRGRQSSTSSPRASWSTRKVISIVDYGVFVRVREGVEGLIPQNEIVDRRRARTARRSRSRSATR